jgi:hypothetical protein
MAALQMGRVISKEQNAPQWVNEVLFLAERLEQKQQQQLSVEEKWEQMISPDKGERDAQAPKQEGSESLDISQRSSDRDEDMDKGLSM